jgi:hypothetical protein
VQFRLGEEILAHFRSSRFLPFLQGVDVELPIGQRLRFKINRIASLGSRRLFQLYRYAYFTEMSAGTICEVGCGDADSELLAIQKSISEAVERCLFRTLKETSFGTQTSNGWAAHISRQLANKAALEELLERDSILVHSLKEIPFMEVDTLSFPIGLRLWIDRELVRTHLSRLRILISTHGHVPSISVMFVDKRGFGVVAHAVGENPSQALKRALGEACRLGRLALGGRHFESSRYLFSNEKLVPLLGPSDQAVAYAYYRPFPEWMFGPVIRWNQVGQLWRRHLTKFKLNPIAHSYTEVLKWPLSSGFCSSPDIQSLFFGRTCDADRRGELNKRRLKLNEGESISDLPHFVA